MSVDMSFPDFSLIKLVPSGNRAEQSGEERIDLYKFFDAIVNKRTLEIYEYQLEEILKKDLSIDTKKYDKILAGVLADALIYFMKHWPGWEKSEDYYSGKIQCKEWFKKFKNYLIVKTTYVINNAHKYNKIDTSKNRTVEIQADLLEWHGDKRISPYILRVGAPPNILNQIVFVELEGNVYLKQHHEKLWPQIGIKQLLNWPYVVVNVQLPDVSITRANTHELHRYLELGTETTIFPEVNAIKHVKKLPNNEDKELQPYSYEFFSLYFKQLVETLLLIPEVKAERVTELEAIFSEFLLDIKEVNLSNSTMCPYVSVAFNIGNCKYIRNKKVNSPSTSSNPTGINFSEIVIPETDVSLNYFNVVQDDTDYENVSFASLNILKSTLEDDPTSEEIKNLKHFVNAKCVKYQCNFCVESFCGSTAYFKLHNHFQDIHKCEQTLVCSVCHNPFEVSQLTSQRWRHTCKSN